MYLVFIFILTDQILSLLTCVIRSDKQQTIFSSLQV